MRITFDLDIKKGVMDFNYEISPESENISQAAEVLYHLVPPISSLFNLMFTHAKEYHPDLYQELVTIIDKEEPVVPPEAVK